MRELSDDFRGVLTEAVDAQPWTALAGPGEAVRRRGERQRRRRMTSAAVGGTAVVVAAAVGLGGQFGSTGGRASALAGAPDAAAGRYVDLAKALLHKEDLGTGFTSDPVYGSTEKFTGTLCSQGVTSTLAGSSVEQAFYGPGPTGVRLMSLEQLYQFPDQAAARKAFDAARAAAVQHPCRDQTGAVGEVRDVAGVGEGMIVVRAPHSVVGGPTSSAWSAYVLSGGVISGYEVQAGSDKPLASLPDSWLVAVMGKAVARIQGAPRLDQPAVVAPIPVPDPGGSTTGAPPAAPLPPAEPVDGILFAPKDLGSSFTADGNERSTNTTQIASATAATGIVFRGVVQGGDGEFLVNETVYTFASADDAAAGSTAYGKSSFPKDTAPAPFPGAGDRAWIKRWTGQQGGLTLAVQVGAKLITIDVLAGGTSADVPIPGGDAWVAQIAKTAVERVEAAK